MCSPQYLILTECTPIHSSVPRDYAAIFSFILFLSHFIFCVLLYRGRNGLPFIIQLLGPSKFTTPTKISTVALKFQENLILYSVQKHCGAVNTGTVYNSVNIDSFLTQFKRSCAKSSYFCIIKLFVLAESVPFFIIECV